MKQEYDFSSGDRGRFSMRGPRRHRASAVGRTLHDSWAVDEELRPAQIRELRRRMADLDDATRYILVSQMGPRFALYYNASEDVYVMNDPSGATLFKRRNAAVAIKKLLGGSIRVVRCKSKRDRGVRVPVLSAARGRRTARAYRRSDRRLQPTARAKRRPEGQRRGAGRAADANVRRRV